MPDTREPEWIHIEWITKKEIEKGDLWAGMKYHMTYEDILRMLEKGCNDLVLFVSA